MIREAVIRVNVRVRGFLMQEIGERPMQAPFSAIGCANDRGAVEGWVCKVSMQLMATLRVRVDLLPCLDGSPMEAGRTSDSY